MKKFLVAIDQGTTSTRVILFDTKGNIKFISQFEFKQYFPKNGWVEHNPNEIWSTTLKALSDKNGAGIGLTLGICVAFIGLIFDNLIRTWVEKRKKHLGIA